MIPKPKRIKDPKYLEWIKKRVCLCAYTWCGGDIVPHHIEAGGMGTKCDDTKTIPLCAKHHRELHDKGKKAFQETYGVDFEKLVGIYQDMYEIDKEVIDMPCGGKGKGGKGKGGRKGGKKGK